MTLGLPRAFWISLCNVVGLACSLAGLLLLFYFSLPNEVPGAPDVWVSPPSSRDWEDQQRRYTTYAHLGLALALVGTIMEAVPPVCTAIGSARRRRRIPAPDSDDLPKRRIDQRVRRKLDELGEAVVRAKLPWIMNVTSLQGSSREEPLGDDVSAPLWAIEQWLAEKDERRQRWVKAAAILAGVAVLVSLLSWLLPKAPVEIIGRIFGAR